MYFKILNDGSAMVTTGRQTTTDAYTFEAFGNPTGQSGTTVNPFRYVGALGYYWFDFAHHGRDRTSGLRLLGARYYGPSPRRFWTQDPVRDALNRYAYAANNPTLLADPSGGWPRVVGCGHLLIEAAVEFACSWTDCLGPASASALHQACYHRPTVIRCDARLPARDCALQQGSEVAIRVPLRGGGCGRPCPALPCLVLHELLHVGGMDERTVEACEGKCCGRGATPPRRGERGGRCR